MSSNLITIYVFIYFHLFWQYDEEAEEQAAQEDKLSQLDAIEARWRAEHEAHQESSYYASSYTSWLSYGTSFVTNIVENLQVLILPFRAWVMIFSCIFTYIWGFIVLQFNLA